MSSSWNTLEKYKVKVSNTALDDLYYIREYVLISSQSFIIADNIVNKIEKAIQNLEYFPYRGNLKYINGKKRRRLFVVNYTVIYSISSYKKEVNILSNINSHSDY